MVEIWENEFAINYTNLHKHGLMTGALTGNVEVSGCSIDEIYGLLETHKAAIPL